MSTDRRDPSVIQAYAVGAVACGHCRQIHIDMIDKNQNIIASGSIDFDQWRHLVVDVEEELKELVNGVPAA